MANEWMTRYIELERLMLEADERGDEFFADSLRDLMDPIWYQLSDAQHDNLNRRGTVTLAILYPFTLSISEAVKISVQRRKAIHRRTEPVVVDGWRMDAA